ncbi:MAG: branched-chain amino acid aminotransferase, partial [Candidatus Hecatellales archaeon B24]
PIREIDNIPVGGGQPGPVTLKLLKEYKEVVHGRRPKYDKWLTYVK